MRLALVVLVITCAHITAAVDSGSGAPQESILPQVFRAIEGPAFRSGKALGSSYMTQNYASWTIDEKVASIIKHTCVKNAFVGATTSLAPFVGVAGGIAGSLYLQVSRNASLQIAFSYQSTMSSTHVGRANLRGRYGPWHGSGG